MAQLTYLQIVNKVLKKLREDQVASVDATDYSALIGEFVNDAKKEVENSWEWSILRTPVMFNSVYGDDENILTATTEDSRLMYDEYDRPMAFDITAGSMFQMHEMTVDAKDRAIYTGPRIYSDQPTHFAIDQLGDGLEVEFLEIPTMARTYRFYFTVPQLELEEDDTILYVPWRPVYNLATLYALDERGEEIGEPGSKAWARYERSLADAISFDSMKDSHKLMFRVV